MLRTLGRLGLLRFAFATYERLLALDVRRGQRRSLPTQAAGLPIPPARLRVLVAGLADVDSFLQIGRAMFEILHAVLRRNGVRLEDLRSVLEVGCGCGRVLRYWKAVRGPRVHGADLNQELIAWCRTNLPFASYFTNSAHPPLPYEDGSFDFVYAISVFTHLSEELQLLWIAELERLVRRGGHLVITTHGANYRGRLTAAEDEAFAAGELVVRYQEASGMNLCSAYHPEAYVRRRLSRGFTVQEFVPARWEEALYQDLYVMRRESGAGPAVPARDSDRTVRR